MKEEIKLPNRDGANLWLEKISETEYPNIFIWELKIDDKHKYCLEYTRLGGDYKVSNNKVIWSFIEFVDPSGGPMINLGDEFEGKYKIVKIIDYNKFMISERNNNQ